MHYDIGKTMKTPQNKKHFQILLGIAVFITIIVMMFIANSQTLLKTELNPPVNGVVKMTTIGGQLIVVSQTNEMHIRDWDNIIEKPLKILNQADQVALMADSKLLRIPSGKPDIIEIECLKKNCSLQTIPLGYGMRCKLLSVNRSGKTAGLVNVDISNKNSDNSYSNFSIAVITPNQLSEITTIKNSDNSLELSDISVSEDSQYIAVAGKKNDLGWIAMIDADQKKLLWEQDSDLSSQFENVIFSPDSQMIYVGGMGRNVLGFETATGKLLNKWQMDLTQKAHKKQYTPAITISNDGSLVASATEPAGVIYLWDTQKNKPAGRLHIGHILISGIAFSPDNRYLAAGAVLMKNKIKILKVTKSH